MRRAGASCTQHRQGTAPFAGRRAAAALAGPPLPAARGDAEALQPAGDRLPRLQHLHARTARRVGGLCATLGRGSSACQHSRAGCPLGQAALHRGRSPMQAARFCDARLASAMSDFSCAICTVDMTGAASAASIARSRSATARLTASLTSAAAQRQHTSSVCFRLLVGFTLSTCREGNHRLLHQVDLPIC